MLEGRGLTPGSTGGFRVAVRRMCQPFACVSLFDTSLFDASLTPLLAPLLTPLLAPLFELLTPLLTPLFELLTPLLTPFQVFSTDFSLMVYGMGARFLKHGCMRLKCLSRVSESKRITVCLNHCLCLSLRDISESCAWSS